MPSGPTAPGAAPLDPQPQPIVMVEEARPHPGPEARPAAGLQVRVEPIRVFDLPAFARAATADPVRYALLPIPPRRAEAQALNPLAQPDDIGLIVGYVGDRCAGFLGLLPGAVEFRGRRHPVSCLSGFYVAPGDRTSGLATMLPLAAIGLDRDLFVTRVSPEVRGLLIQLGFWPAPPQRVLRLRLSKFKKLKGIPLRALVRAFSGGVDVGDHWHLATEVRTPMTAEWADQVAQVTAGKNGAATGRAGRAARAAAAAAGLGAAAAALTPDERPRFVRDEGVINWMVRNPWIGEDSHATLPYTLPYRREMFRYLVLEANAGGYVVLNVTQDQRFATLRILDRRPTTDAMRASVLARALVEAQRLVADVVECPAEYEPLLRSTFAGRMLLATDERVALVHTRDPEGPFGKYLDAMDWSGFEGDAAFF